MKKKIILIILILLLTGCTSEYNLKISNNSFKENINVYIKNSEIPNSENGYIEINGEQIEIDDQVTPFINNKNLAVINSNKYYNKKVIKYDDYILVNLNYKYNEKDFKNSSSLNLCFDNFYFNTNNIYELSASGSFKCLYSESIDIRIETKNKVLSNNADEIDGNTYIWNITRDNVDDIDIEIKLEKGLSYKTMLLYLLVGSIIIGIIVFSIVSEKKRKHNNEI